MERVSGIGGVFFAAEDPAMLTDWYARNLGVDPPPAAEGDPSWQQDAGETVFTAMSVGSPIFGRSKTWAINFRVRDLDAMVSQLEANGVSVEVGAQQYSYGRFASLTDPEGNVIQLWQLGNGSP